MHYRSSPLPRRDGIPWTHTLAPSPLGGIIVVCVLHSLSDLTSGTKLQFPMVVTGLITHYSWLPSLPVLLPIPLFAFPENYFPNKLQLNSCLRAALGKPKPSHQVTANRHNLRDMEDPAASFSSITCVCGL